MTMKKQLLIFSLFFCSYALSVQADPPELPAYDNAEYRENEAAFNAIGLNKAYTGKDNEAYSGFSGLGVTVAVVDGGTMTTHADLKNKTSLLYNYFYNLAGTDHGTHVSGIIAAEKNGTDTNPGGMHGVAYNASYLPFSVRLTDGCNEDGCPEWFDVWEMLATEPYDDIKIVNNSWGIEEIPSANLSGTLKYVKMLVAKDKLIIAAAGNETKMFPNELPAGIGAKDSTLKNNIISVVAYDPKLTPANPKFI